MTAAQRYEAARRRFCFGWRNSNPQPTAARLKTEERADMEHEAAESALTAQCRDCNEIEQEPSA